MKDRFDAATVLPLHAHLSYILLSLVDGPRHGYAIRRDIEYQTDGQITIPIASLYRHIDNMDKDGWIEWCKDRPVQEDDDPRRRYYQLTPLGRMICHAEMQRLKRMVESRNGRLALDSLLL
jgi:DNA-binding PadR family transcriptional regulator